MSIPPLVCSTPPPPEQCVEENYHEDYDLIYNLSQDDDENIDFGFSDCIQSSAINTKINLTTTNLITEKNSQIDQMENIIRGLEDNASDHFHIKTEILNTQQEDSKEILDHIKSSIEKLNLSDYNQDISIESTIIEDNTVVSSIEENLATAKCDLVDTTIERDEFSNNEGVDINDGNQSIISTEKISTVTVSNEEFNEFNLANYDLCTNTLDDNFSNPWDIENPNNTDFVEFKANFEEIESVPPDNVNWNSESNDHVQKEKCINNCNNEDEFEDFDDFKSSLNTETVTQEIQNTPISHDLQFTFPSAVNEDQIIETTNTTLISIFPEEIRKPDKSFEEKLESLLCETWGYLVQVDERQPYMINWNNSLGQKILLKALCIDSRNILFGPKWNNSMPKYAANLCSTPLQPQKPSTPSVHQSENRDNEMAAHKVGSMWMDPLTADTQGLSDPGSENVAFELKPKVDLCKDAIKENNLHSDIMSMPTVCHINLPDTHIFTPTDSETPRSKTIHYDCIPRVLLAPETVKNTNIDTTEKSISPKMDTLKDEEYSDFQDFKENIHYKSFNETSVPDASTSSQLQILQPIKVEPITPTLNWPDPGQVKETFDDFSDFVSNLSWNNDNTDKCRVKNDTNDSGITNNHCMPDEVKASNIYLDDFDTFQSAFPSTKVDTNNLKQVDISTQNVIREHHSIESLNTSVQTSSFDTDVPKLNHYQQDFLNNDAPTFSSSDFNLSLKPSDSVSTSVETNKTTFTQNTLFNHSVIQNTGQILQPLSLESYSQINWSTASIDLQDLSTFNPIESVQSLKTDASISGKSSPGHSSKNMATNDLADDDVWGEFVSIKPKQQPLTKKPQVYTDEDDWTDFISNSTVKPLNGLNTISFNVHTNLNAQKLPKRGTHPLDNNQRIDSIPTLNFKTPKSSSYNSYDSHFQNL